MTAKLLRLILVASAIGFIVVSDVAADRGYLWAKIIVWVIGALMLVGALFVLIGTWTADRRDRRSDDREHTASPATGIQELRIGEYADGEPATFHFPGDGDVR